MSENERKKVFSDKSLDSYEHAMKAAEGLDITNPIRLGLALNFSVFYYEVIGDQATACNIAKEIIAKANEPLSNVDPEDEEHKDAISIINLLQENLNMWTTEGDQ